MKELGISGTLLSEYLRIDSSLVSKWRNGSRKINSEYLNTIIQLALSMDSITNYQRISRIAGFAIGEDGGEEKLKDYLRVWLATVETCDSTNLDAFAQAKGKLINGYVFVGENAKREAVKIFLDYSAQGADQEIWLFSDQDSDWLFKGSDYRFEWQNKNFALLENNKIHVLHPIFKGYQHVAEYMIRWLPLHMYGETQANYIPQFHVSNTEFTICLTAGVIALISVTAADKSRQPTTYLLSDPVSLQCVQNIILSLFDKSKPLFQRYSYHDNVIYRRLYQEFSSEKSQGLFFGGGLPQCLIPAALLRSFLNESDYSRQELQEYQDILYSICYENTARGGLAPISIILHLDQLCNLLQFKQVTMRTLSYCMGKPVYIRQEQFRKSLMAVLDIVESNSEVHLFLTDHSVFHPHADIDMFIRERKVANFTSSFYCEGTHERNLVIQESVMVSAIFHNMNYYMQTHPNSGMPLAEVRSRMQALFQKYSISNCIDTPLPIEI